MSVREAFCIGLVLFLFSFLLIVPLMNLRLFVLTLVALFLAVSYPFTKRFFPVPQAYLGVAFGFGIPMAFAAAQNTVPLMAWVLLAASFFWTISYDTAYAMIDRNDDIKLGRIQTSAITFGRHEVAIIMVSHFISLALIAVAGLSFGLGWVFLAGIGAAALAAGRIFLLIRTRQRAACWQAFIFNNWVGASVFAGIALDYLVRA